MAGPETQLQTLVRNTLAVLGYTVIETGKARSKVACPKCRTWHYPVGWQGNTPGCPDLYIHAPHWKQPVALAVELKTPKGAVRREQKNMADQNMTVICRDLDSVINAVLTHERKHGEPVQVERLEKFLERNKDRLGFLVGSQTDRHRVDRDNGERGDDDCVEP